MLHIRLHKMSWFYVIVMMLAWVDFILDHVVAVIEQGPKVFPLFDGRTDRWMGRMGKNGPKHGVLSHPSVHRSEK